MSRGFRWAIVFGLALLALAAVPVLADGGEPSLTTGEEAAPPIVAPGAEIPAGVKLPSAVQMTATLKSFEEQEEARRTQLESPAFVQQREASRYAYDDLTRAKAEDLLTSLFADSLAALNRDPSRVLSDAKLDRSLGEGDANVTIDGKTQLLEGTLPVKAENEEGELKKVDLSLEKTNDDWEPANPLVEVGIGAEVQEGIEVGDEGVTITQVGAEGSEARPLGDMNVFYGEVDEGTDTDLLVSPVSGGVELFDLLRSVDSPETLRFHVDVPQGARLRANAGGGAEVVSDDGKIVGVVPPAHAVDAQGTSVPVSLAVEGDSIVLDIRHREMDVAYPLLVDPLYQDWGWWYANQHLSGLGAWAWNENQTGWLGHGYMDNGAWPGWPGLAIYSAPGNPLPAGQWGQWFYSAPNAGSYLSNAVINPFLRRDDPCNAPSQPYDYEGMWNETSWNRITFNEALQGWTSAESWGRAYIFGMGTSSGNSIACWRHVMAGGIGIYLDDWQYPNLDSVGATPEGWLKKDATPRTFSVSASDAGLGVRTVRMFGVGTQEWLWNKGWCAGTYENRCSTAESGQITFTTNGFPYEGRYNSEGIERNFTVQVVDATEKTGQLQRPIWLDGTAPSVSLSGQLATATKQAGSEEKPQGEGNDELSLPTYKLQVSADDGADRSGVKEIKVYLDKDPSKEPGAVPTATKSASSCPSAGCERTLDMAYTLRLPGLAAGKHSLWIVAVDKVGNQSPLSRNIEFEYTPATGMKDEYVMQHFRLPDGNDYSGEAEYHGPEIAVNVINGNVVFHQRDLNLGTDRARIELERVYNVQQPTKQDTQWGRGWEISQAPAFQPEPEQVPAQTATMLRSGTITSSVPVPQASGQETFSARLRATVKKTAGGYEVEPVGGDESTTFDSNGRIQEVVLGDDTPVYLEPRTEEELELLAPGAPTYASSFGSAGAGNGQFSHPADVAIDSEGNLWVPDKLNNRIQKFDPQGQFIAKYGSLGSGAGQLSGPSSIAFDAAGNFWVAERFNNRLQKFNRSGESLKTVGTSGSGNGQFSGPEGIAIAPNGHIFVSDTYNYRVQELNANGEFIKVVNPGGLGAIEPTGIAADANGDIWVTDWSNNRVVELSEAGALIRSFGTAGTGDGQLNRPDAVEVDAQGKVWIGDQNNGRIQIFNQHGEYVTKFGASGSGEGQFSFSYPFGLAVGANGTAWIADADHNRIQRWKTASILEEKVLAPYFEPPVLDYEYENGKLEAMQLEDEATEGPDPELALVLSANMVTEVESEEAGDTSYAYEGARMTVADGSSGETKYTYDGSERLTSVMLPNGTAATITYDETSRATSVKVDPAGPEAAKTTNFSYQAEPRRTTVWGGGSAEITYDVGEDGSVLKWAWAEAPPTLEPMSGSLVSKKGQEIEKNKDLTLFITGDSPHGIGSIKVLANGSSVAAEETCVDNAAPPDHHCDRWTLPWVTSASDFPPGRLDLEVIVADLRGHQASERFYVFVPQPDPPDPDVVPRPDFNSIKLQREENGLDRGKSLSSFQLTELILELLNEWERRDNAPVRAVEEFGVPMRATELAEMEYRRAYVAQASEVIPEWAETHAPSTYGGYYVDDRAGGIIHVGFTGSPAEQAATVEALKASGVLMAPARVEPMPVPPQYALANVESLEQSVINFIDGSSSAGSLTASVGYSADTGKVMVESPNPPALSSILSSQFGAAAPIEVIAQTPVTASGGRFHVDGTVYGGDWILNGATGGACTANYSGEAQVGGTRGNPDIAYFKLTAGHCGAPNVRFWRKASRAVHTAPSLNDHKWAPIGRVERPAFAVAGPNGLYTDAEGIEAVQWKAQTSNVFYGNPHRLLQIYGMSRMKLNRRYCWSGMNGGLECGRAFLRDRTTFVEYPNRPFWGMWIAGANIQGDSGSPVWDEKTKKAVGILSGSKDGPKKKCVPKRHIEGEPLWCPLTLVTPLLPFADKSYPIGAMQALGVGLVRGL